MLKSMNARRSASGTGATELELLRAIRSRRGRVTRRGSIHLGIGDDCALLGVQPGEELAVTTDLSIAGRHFRMDWHPPESVGHRTLARGLSDLAAMGARPVAAFLSLGIPRNLTVKKGRGGSWIERFYNGLFRLADANRTPLAGGDLAESPVALADIVLIGAVAAGKALRRVGARPGDRLYVTGALGAAAAGLAKLAEWKAKPPSWRWTSPERVPSGLAAHLYPRPRISQGLALMGRGLASAAIDLSDGLSTDLAHICEESGVAAVIQAELIPVAKGASLGQALHGGEDYELLFAAPASVRMPRSLGGITITQIGQTTRLQPGKPSVTIATGAAAQPLSPRGWQHFTDH
jgi:thiamine-monophosphate kinase